MNAQKLDMIFAMMIALAADIPPALFSSLLEKSKKSRYPWISCIENGVQGAPVLFVRFSVKISKLYGEYGALHCTYGPSSVAILSWRLCLRSTGVHDDKENYANMSNSWI